MSVPTRRLRTPKRAPNAARPDHRLRVEQLEDRWVPATTYFVTTFADTSTTGTLRFALEQANAANKGTVAVPDIIQFTTGAGTVIVGGTPLPTVTDILVIDATTATGYSGVPIITLDGTLAGKGASGLTVSAGSSTVKGLDIVNFAGHGIRLDTNGGNTLVNNVIGVTTAGATAGNGANGVFISDSADNTVGGTGATDFNVISGNGGDGIRLDGPAAQDNTVVANFIGTDATGSLARGNAGNGIQITNGARRNTVGGNTPTATAFTGKPVDGNVISGNGANGVLLTTGAGFNTLSGNFIGTNLAGTAALGNALDGVAVVDGANNNALIGTTFPQPPFVYLNLVSGNGGNGLRVRDSNNTTVQANAFGIGDDNLTPVPNRLNGVLIEGSSSNTQFGGVIPLGNIVAGNLGNGVEIRDTATGTVCFNTFCGLPAFTTVAVGNGLDGFLITSTGGNNLLRTNVISGNRGNGVHISGDATGVQVAEDIIGMNTSGQVPLPNGANGILIDGTAHDNTIGGVQVSVIFQNTISANGGNGIAIVGSALGNRVVHSFIGTNIEGTVAFGNAGAGVFVGGAAAGNTIGGTAPFDQNIVSGNGGGGIVLGGGTLETAVLGNLIGTDRTGLKALANLGSGVAVFGSNNRVGGTAAGEGNTIAFNALYGVAVTTGTGNGVLGNSIFGNAAPGIALSAGGNLNQAAPVLTATDLLVAGTVEVTGILAAAPNAVYRVEFFASPTATPGQGRTFLGFATVATDASGAARFVTRLSIPADAGTSVTATATDAGENTSPFSAPTAADVAVFAVGADAGDVPQVNVYNADGSLRFSFLAFESTFRGGVRVAVGHLGGQQVVAAAAGPGGGPRVRVLDAATGQQVAGPLGDFFAYESSFTGGVFVAVGDVDGDGVDDVVTGAGAGGGPHVKVFSGRDGSVVQSFFAYDASFLGGVSVAAGYLGSGVHADIVTGAGAGGGPEVRVFDGTNPAAVLASYFAFATDFTGGVSVAAGDLRGGAADVVIVGAGSGGGPRVNLYAGLAASPLVSFFAYDTDFQGGVRVGAFDHDGDGRGDLLTGPGPGGGPEVRIGSSATRQFVDSFFAFATTFQGGVFVGG